MDIFSSKLLKRIVFIIATLKRADTIIIGAWSLGYLYDTIKLIYM